MWIDREISSKIINSTKSRPVTLLTGVRQCGKSSLLKKLYPNAEYHTFDNFLSFEAAKENPASFLKQFSGQVILDEVQYLPELFKELKIRVDQERENYGKWILTGSQHFELMENISETLAGRINIIHLETLSAHELRNKNVILLKEYLWKGGYPELWSNKKLEVSSFFESYIKTYIERDLRSIIEVRNLSDFQRFLRTIATRAGQLVNYKNIANDVGVSDMTIRSWFHALEVSGIIYLLAPYYANINKRLVKSPKIYFADHGLLCHLLGVENSNEWESHIYKGALWENFVFMELIKTNSLVPGKDIFFYRDQNGVEIDFIIEKKGKLTFIEAKANEKIDKNKLNFKKVFPLFNNIDIEGIVAIRTTNEYTLELKNFKVFNPLKTLYDFG
ncbi:MAG: ATP-binding protein [Nitrospinae bacterium]|nr:ATP-binding protein [Nitrospinota bacterium]